MNELGHHFDPRRITAETLTNAIELSAPGAAHADPERHRLLMLEAQRRQQSTHRICARREREEWIEHCSGLGDSCSQCGLPWSASACGPTHAAIAATRSGLSR